MINVSEIIGKSSAVFHSDGLKLFWAIQDEEKPVILSFEGIKYATFAFLNASIGKAKQEGIRMSFVQTDKLFMYKIKRIMKSQ